MGIVYELGTLSKVLAPALRIGYMAGRDSPFLRAIIQKTSDTSFSAPLFCQDIAEYMLDHHMAGQISAVNRGYRHKARIVKAWIRKYLGQEVEWCRGGKAGFYYYLSFRSVETHEESPFFRYLSRTTGRHGIDGPAHRPLPKVIYLPGIYCVHAGGRSAADAKRQLRISYGFEELERIHNAFRIMNKAIDFAQKKS
jgi:DNA-binding transcriptional MocR family regulator